MASLFYEDRWLQVWSGDNRDALRQMPEQSVHTVITSPPYYGLREYGTAQWEGGDPDCDHKPSSTGKGTNIPQTKNPGVDYPASAHRGGNPNICGRCGATRIEPTIWGGDPDHEHEWGVYAAPKRSAGGERDYGSSDGAVGRGPAPMLPGSVTCECGAWRGALGLEPTPEEYIEHLVEVFRGVKRVLRDDGICWLNLGDSYNTYAASRSEGNSFSKNHHGEGGLPAVPKGYGLTAKGLKPKDLIGIPWMAAFALRTDGWYLRGDIVWAKPNAMPESVEDRPTRSHEFIFMLTKQPRYFYDHLAVKEPASEATLKALKSRMDSPIMDREYQHDSETRMGKRSPNRVWSDPEAMKRLLAGRNMRDVWNVATVSYPGAHYATFPPKLVEPMIKASTSERGVCPECGAPWMRQTVELGVVTAKGGEPHTTAYGRMTMDQMDDLNGAGETGSGFGITAQETVGWAPTCDHTEPTDVYPDSYLGDALEAGGEKPLDPVPATVLDIFGGSGTLAMVAQQLSRRAILIDLNAEYIEQQMQRNAQVGLGL